MKRRTFAIAALALPLVATAHTWRMAPVSLRHGEAPPRDVGGPIDLVDHTGARFTDERLRGRHTLLFFGFTRCVSTCPVAMHDAQQVLAAFDAAARVPPQIVFVSLDIGDRPGDLARYLGKFDPRIVGLTGNAAAVERVADAYGVGRRRHASGGAIDHSSVWYLIGADGRTARVYRFGTPVKALIDDLTRLAAR